MEHHRFSINVGIQAQENSLLQQCTRDKTLRVMVFCATSNVDVQNIAFPHQSELKVNGEDVKANLRGLKNKPGSTRPVDITDLLRLRIAAYRNSVEFTYALTKNVRHPSSLGVQPFPKAHFQAIVLTINSVSTSPCSFAEWCPTNNYYGLSRLGKSPRTP